MSLPLTIVIPTRNRADLAQNAAESCLIQRLTGDRVIISDNSTLEEHSVRLQVFCKQSDTEYVRPDKPCSMSAHWSWLLSRAISGEWGDRLILLTDRMVFKSGALQDLRRIATKFPMETVVYPIDAVRDDELPIRLLLHDWTGRLARVPSEKAITLLLRAAMPLCVPLLLNTMVPVSSLRRMAEFYPIICDTIAPDYSFCLKFLDTHDHYIFFDKPILLQYALGRSNGRSFTSGRNTPERQDFLQNLPPATKMNQLAPIPEIPVAANTAAHEYVSMTRRRTLRIFPPLDLPAYYEALRHQILQIEDERERNRLLELLPPSTNGSPKTPFAARSRRLLRRILWPIGGKAFNRLWRFSAQYGRPLPGMRWLSFQTPHEARQIGASFMIRPSTHSFFLRQLGISENEAPSS